MKKYLITAIIAIIMITLVGCAPADKRNVIIAEVTLQDGSVVSGYVEYWDTYSTFSDLVIVKIDGVKYITDASCVTIIKGDVSIETD